MDYLGKGEMLTNRNVNKISQNLREIRFLPMEHFCNLLFQLMKHGTNTLHVAFLFFGHFYFLVIPSLSQPDADNLIHAFIFSRIDYGNVLFGSLPAKSPQRLQIIQNSAARDLTRTKKSDPITLILAQLH
jgi:hypothetical protein